MKYRLMQGLLTTLLVLLVALMLLAAGEYVQVVDVVVNGHHHEARTGLSFVTNIGFFLALVYWTGRSLQRSRAKIREIKRKRKERP